MLFYAEPVSEESSVMIPFFVMSLLCIFHIFIQSLFIMLVDVQVFASTGSLVEFALWQCLACLKCSCVVFQCDFPCQTSVGISAIKS